MTLERVLRRWRWGQLLALGARALGIATLGVSLTWVMLPAGTFSWLLAALLALALTLVSLWLPHPPMVTRNLLARHLDRVLPELEDSVNLVNQDPAGLTGLEQLQRQRIEKRLQAVSTRDLRPREQLTRALRFLVGALVLAVLIWVGRARWTGRSTLAVAPGTESAAEARQAPELLAQVTIEVRPPAYTGLPEVRQDVLDVSAAEGSVVRWLLPEAVDRGALLLPDREPLEFRQGDAGMEVEMVAAESVVYQLAVGAAGSEVRSPYARLGVTPDEPPRLTFTRPEARITTATEPNGRRIPLRIEAEDEFGLQSVELVTTLAKGSGELVEFRQRRQTLGPIPQAPAVSLEAELDLSQLGLEQGSELYFFVEGRDQRAPEANVARSATYIVRVPAERLTSADLGEGLPIVVPPEYFRSQRQIIIDTERLIAESAEMARSELERRSESLGFDQRALRMRYGILLGEEFESGRPLEEGDADGDGDGDHEDHAGESEEPLRAVPADLVHLHDSAEITTFFTSEIRTQLKQVLAHMWDAEGELRIHRPEEALPYEYQALEMLKDLQQRSRVYVQKVGFETPPLEPSETRLTGDLEEIDNRSRVVGAMDANEVGRAAEAIAAVLQARDRPGDLSLADAVKVVRPAIADIATRDSQALTALAALDLWVSGAALSEGDRSALEGVLWHLVPPPPMTPRVRGFTSNPLGDLYRARLAGKGRP